MLFKRIIFYLILIVYFYQLDPLSIAEEKALCDKYFNSVLSIASSTEANPELYPQILDDLDDLDKKGKNTNICLVALLDYYIGEGAREILSEYITEKGKVMLPILREKKKKPLECIPKYKSICSERKTRDDGIDQLVDAIEKGIVLRTDE